MRDSPPPPVVFSNWGENRNVSFKVCAVTMQRFAVDKSQLITGVEVVRDAIIEIVNKQEEGLGVYQRSTSL